MKKETYKNTRKEYERLFEKHTVLDIMLHVAELGLLRDNKEQLARMEGYAVAWQVHNDGKMRINPNGIEARLYVGPGKLGEWADITFSVLYDLYSDDDEEFDSEMFEHCYLEDEFYQVYKGEEE